MGKRQSRLCSSCIKCVHEMRPFLCLENHALHCCFLCTAVPYKTATSRSIDSSNIGRIRSSDIGRTLLRLHHSKLLCVD